MSALADVQAEGVQGRAGVVAQGRPGPVEVAADVGPHQPDRAVAAAAGGGEPVAEKHGLIDLQAVGVQGGARVVAQLRPVTFEAGVPGEETSLRETVVQLKADIRGEILQVKPTSDPRPPKP